MSARVTSAVEEYLAAVPDEPRATLETIREAVRAAAPGAEETISYQIPTFTLNGALVAYSVAKNHCSFHLMSPELLAQFQDELTAYETIESDDTLSARHAAS